MDESFNNVVEGTRQYFMGLPKPSQDGSVQQVWSTGSPADKGTPAPSSNGANSSRPPSVVTSHPSRPPSAAAAPPSTSAPINIPSRPPSEPLEPEPHIIHKATVMREAAEKRRELPEIEDEEEAGGALSPPPHIIRKPTPHLMPSPAPASAVPSPSPVRPPSASSSLPSSGPEQLELTTQYRTSVHRVQTPTIRPPEHYNNTSRTDSYTTSRQTEHFMRYQYDPSPAESSRLSHSSSIAASPQPSVLSRQSPQSYARISSAIPQHTNRLNETSIHNSIINQRYSIPSQPPPPHNDRVPPIHHPQAVPAAKVLTANDIRSSQIYKSRETYSRTMSNYERHQPISQRKYDHQQTHSGYRTSQQVTSNHNIDKRNHNQYKHGTTDVVNTYYTTRPPDRSMLAHQPHIHEHHRVIPRTDYVNKNPTNSKNYNYPVPSTSSVRYVQNASVSINQNNTSAPPRSNFRSAVAPKSNYDYSALNQSQTSPSRPTIKAGYQNPQTKMTVSVTSIVDQMNQTKQKRESPLDLSVKTVKNSADSSTTQDDVVESSASMKNDSFTLQPRLSSGNRTNITSYSAYGASHKVDFSPDFAQYRGERVNASHNYNVSPQSSLPGRHNEAFDQPRPLVDPCSIESRQVFAERTKYQNINRSEYVPRIDLTRSNSEDPHLENRIRDDRHFIIEDRKRIGGPDISNIPKKIVKYETWSSDSRIDRLSQSAREQRELMSRPVYNYQSYKRFEAYQNDQKRPQLTSAYRDSHPHVSHRYLVSHFAEQTQREVNEYHGSYNDKILSVANSRHIIQKIPNHRDIHPHLKDMQQPADKKVLSILRNSLEIKQNYTEPLKSSSKIPDLIVIDDGDDPVIDITDLTKETDSVSTNNKVPKNNEVSTKQTFGHDIQMPKAIDSITRDDSYEQSESKTKSPENDVASRIRTKAELKVMPPTQDSSNKNYSSSVQSNETKVLPKSQKQHLFNQIREDNLRLESVIKTERPVEIIQEIKSEPMNIEEIENDAIRHIKTEHNHEVTENNEPDVKDDLDMDWTTACDSFMEQLKEGCHKRKASKKITDNINLDKECKVVESNAMCGSSDKLETETDIILNIKEEPKDQEEEIIEKEIVIIPKQVVEQESPAKTRRISKCEKNRHEKKIDKENEKINKKVNSRSNKNKINRTQTSLSIKKEVEDEVPIVKIKEEAESTDDDEPLIKSKLLKEKEQSDRMKYQLLKELAEKSAYVKLECCDDFSTRRSLDSINKDREAIKTTKNKLTRNTSKDIRRFKEKQTIADTSKNEGINDLSSDSDDDVLSVASRLRVRKVIKSEDLAIASTNKTSTKSSPMKKIDSSSSCSTPLRKSGFGDGSDFHPGWEEELYKYKRSLRMPTRLIAIPRGRSGGPFFLKNCANQLARGSTSLPDLDPVPLSPAPSSAPSAATDDIYRRPDKNILDSDLESNSSCSAFNNRFQYDSEASTSTIFSSTNTSKRKGKSNSIVDVLIKKCGRKEEAKKKLKDKEEKSSKVLPKNSNTSELLPTPSLGLVKNGSKGNLCAKKEKLMEDIFYLGAFRKETVTMFRTAFINNTNGLIGATEEFAPVVLKSRTRTESRVLKQRATIKEVFGDDRPASAPPSSCREEYSPEAESPITTKKAVDLKNKLKPKTKNKMLRRSSSIRDGLRSTKSLKRNDAKGRMMRLKKRNSLLKSLISNKKNKLSTNIKVKTEKIDQPTDEKVDAKEDNSIPSTTETNTKKRFKRLFGRRKFSSGFDYIRKKKKIIRRDNSPKVRRQAPKPSPESVHDIQKEIKGWFINKSIGETHLHRAARLGFTDCVAYCLEKMKVDPSAKDNAGFTALHVASAKGYVRIARLLLQYGANVSAAAQGGIRPLHEACENSHVEVIRLLLAYGADPILGTYAGQMPEELAEGAAAKLLRLHIADVQGLAVEPWIFPSPAEIIDRDSLGCDPLSSPPPSSPPPPPDSTIEIQCSEAPLPPFYSLRSTTGQPVEGLWCLLQDITNTLQIKSKESLLKQIHCGSGSPKELLREIKTQEFLERAQCHQLLCAGEKVNIRASKVALIRVTDKLRQLLKIETVLVS